MKAFAFAALCSTVMLAALSGALGAKAHKSDNDNSSTRFDDVPGIEACCYELTSTSSSIPSYKDGGAAAAGTMTLLHSISFEEPTVSVLFQVSH